MERHYQPDRDHRARHGHHKSRSSKGDACKAHIQHDKSPPMLERKGSRAMQLEQIANMRSLSDDDEYVRRWLATAEPEKGPVPDSNETSYDDLPNDRRKEGQHFIIDRQQHLINFAKFEASPKHKWMRNYSSSDSSLIESPPIRRAFNQLHQGDPLLPMHKAKKLGRNTEQHGFPIAERVEEPGATSKRPGASSKPRSTFEKRARYKTREDRYEPKKFTKDRESHQDQDGAHAKKKRISRSQRKTSKTGGGHLMQNFKSDKIANERLTLQPSHGPGLFRKGRASSPVQRRGVPDLAFSEMEFLQHSGRHQTSMLEDHSRTKFRERERNRASKVQEDISTFFQPSRAVLKDIETNGQYSSLRQRDRRTSGRDGREDYQSYHHPPPSYHHGSTVFSSKHTILSSKETSQIGSRITTLPQTLADIPSERATSYLSWPETQISPAGNHVKIRSSGAEGTRRTHSSTPESIRNIIRNTGIFRDTGIGNNSANKQVEVSRRSFGNRIDSEVIGKVEIQPSEIRPLCSYSKISTTLEADLERADQAICRQSDLPSLERMPGQSPASFIQAVLEKQPRECLSQQRQATNSKPHVELFESGRGWHSGIPASATRSKPPRRTLLPLDRARLAKYLRIRRPISATPMSNRERTASQRQNSGKTQGRQEKLETIPEDASMSAARSNCNLKPPKVINIEEQESMNSQGAAATMQSFDYMNDISIVDAGLAADLAKRNQSKAEVLHVSANGRVQTPVNAPYVSFLQSRNPYYLGLPVRGGSSARQVMPRPIYLPFSSFTRLANPQATYETSLCISPARELARYCNEEEPQRNLATFGLSHQSQEYLQHHEHPDSVDMIDMKRYVYHEDLGYEEEASDSLLQNNLVEDAWNEQDSFYEMNGEDTMVESTPSYLDTQAVLKGLYEEMKDVEDSNVGGYRLTNWQH